MLLDMVGKRAQRRKDSGIIGIVRAELEAICL
jgi:hypothetical protein